MSLSSKIVSNTLISYSGRVVSIVFALFSIGLITRSLGQEGFGEYTTVLAFLSLFVILSDLGLHSLMTREISRPASPRARFSEPEARRESKAGTEEDFGPIVSNFFTLRLIASLFFLLSVGVIVQIAYLQLFQNKHAHRY